MILLVQVDSLVGGKIVVNLVYGKNLVGVFYQLKFVIVDIGILVMLLDCECQVGYVEIIKYGLINDLVFVDWFDEYGCDVLVLKLVVIDKVVVVLCCVKVCIVVQDECEGGVWVLLNLGYMFGYVFEVVNGYGLEFLYGEVVGIGMVFVYCYLV